MSVVESMVNFSERLKTMTVAVKLSQSRLGTKKGLTKDQIEQAADEFGADKKFLSASKKLLDTKHPKYQDVTSILNKARGYWESVTLDYPEDGIRLLRTEAVERFEAQMREFKDDLQTAVTALQEEYSELRSKARQDLGHLFREDDYPADIRDKFSLEFAYVAIEPARHLIDSFPELYERERQRIQARFEESLAIAEESFAVELQKTLAHAVDRLTDDSDGKRKKLCDSTVDNLRDFIQRFRNLDIGSNPELGELIDTVELATRNVDVTVIKKSDDIRTIIRDRLAEAQTKIDEMIVNMPRRKFDL